MRNFSVLLCGSLLGAITLPLNIYALQNAISQQPLWLPVTAGSLQSGHVLNPAYWPTQLSMSLGPVVGCAGAFLLVPGRRRSFSTLIDALAACLIGYFALSVLGLILKMREGFHPYILCLGSWVFAIALLIPLRNARSHGSALEVPVSES